jgi:hypothetical protein
MILQKSFNGRLNYDDDAYRVPHGDYLDALNITRDSSSVSKDEVVSNVQGNTLVNYSLPSGTNKVIGNLADKTRNRIYYFVWNSNGYHLILYYDATADSVVKVLANLTDTGSVDILGFNPSYRINHIDIIYRDTVGDLLFWTDALNPPSKINVLTATTGGYGTVLRSYIDVAKEPPPSPPYCVYENDATVTVNNLNKKVFKLKTRWVYDDLEKSVTSSQSEIPLPYFSTPTGSQDPTINADIFMVIPTGSSRVKKIQVLGSEAIGNTFSDFFLIEELDKSANSIPDNDVTTYRFYNNKAYTNIDITESIQDYDRVPLIADTQALPNGNVVDYCGTTEGYNLFPVNLSTDASGNVLAYQRIQMVLLSATQASQQAFGTGNIRIIVAGTVLTGSTYNIVTSAGTITYTAIGGDTVASVLTALSASAVGLGFTQISLTTNNLVVFKTGATLVSKAVTSGATSTYGTYNSIPAYDWTSKYSYGVVYFDAKGRTNGEVSPVGSLFQTHKYAESGGIPLIPQQTLTISNRPPLWATYFQIVRTSNLSKGNFIQWISDYTYKDTISNNQGYKFAYISINNLTQYISDNPTASANLGYTFQKGDRIKFIKLFNGDGTTAQIYDGNDFLIQGSLINPIVNGTQLTGQVIQIVLPTTSGTFDFGTDSFANYMIELYTPALNFSANATLYYEFGEYYIVGNPGTGTAYHQGMTQNQTSNLSQPALYVFDRGDDYALFRQVNRGGLLRFIGTPANGISAGGAFYYFGNTLQINTPNTTQYTAQGNNPSYGRTSSNWNIHKTSGTDITFRVKGTITLISNIDTNVTKLQAFCGQLPGTGGTFNNFVILNLSPLAANTPASFTFDTTITMLAAEPYLWWQLSLFSGNLVSCKIDITDNSKQTLQQFISQNISDFYDSAVNSNGRAWTYDNNAAQVHNPTLNRFSEEFQSNTTINNTNRFYDKNYDIYDRSNGAAKKLFIEGYKMYVFQEFDIGVVTIRTQIVTDTSGNPLSAQSDNLLNKIVYPYVGKLGIGNVPESFAHSKHAKYGVDNNKGIVWRLSEDGLIPLSILYKTNAFFVSVLANFRTDLNQPPPATGTPTVYGGFDAYTNKYIVALSVISRNGFSQEAYTYSFLETRDTKEGFETRLSYAPENISCLNNLLVTFNAGKIWKHNSNTFCNFYGVQYDAFIKTAFNDAAGMMKTFISLQQQGNIAWDCSEISTQTLSYGTTNQSSSIVAARFQLLEGKYSCAFLRDANSHGGLINGDILKGGYIIIKFKVQNAANLVILNTASVYFINSPLNLR